MRMDELQRSWDELGKVDPLWAILGDPDKMGGRWDLHEFFKTGEEEVAAVLQYVDSLHLPLARRRALDFGCGVGRVTRALGRHFEECSGVDIAPSMIRLAQEYNRQGSRCQYYLNESDDLRLFDDNRFDFIYSSNVLQHIHPRYSRNYLKEFVRLLAPGGVLVFQIPSGLAAFREEAVSDQGSISGPLPDSAFRARIRPHESSMTARAGFPTMVRVTIKNLGDVAWPRLGAGVLLGARWLDEAGALVADAEGRSSLPGDLGPGEEVESYLAVNTPTRPGDYVLELDMIQETVAWFQDRGSETAKVRVEVRGGPGPVASHPAEEAPVGARVTVEMHGVAREEVLRLISGSGGKLVDVCDDLNGGPEWVSFRYCVVKE